MYVFPMHKLSEIYCHVSCLLHCMTHSVKWHHLKLKYLNKTLFLHWFLSAVHLTINFTEHKYPSIIKDYFTNLGIVAHTCKSSIFGNPGKGSCGRITWGKEFEISLGNIERPCLLKHEKKKKIAGCNGKWL